MRVVIIGGSGHIGTYLVPTLVEMGYEVINLTRGQSKPYTPNRAWEAVTAVTVDRDAEDAAGTFGERVKALKPDIVIDLICFTEESNRQLVEALRGQVQHFIHCGTIWVYGHSTQVPALEDQPRHPFGNYGIQKAAIEAYLMREARLNGFPATDLLVGHITGPGWRPINAQANLNVSVFEKLAHGEALPIPNLGLETLHHVHAADVAQMFVQAITHWSASVGESFHTVSPAALTLRGYAEAVAGWFGQAANLQFMAWDEYATAVGEVDAGVTKDHIGHSPNASIAKAQRMIDYQPRYSSLQAIHEAVDWLVENGQVKV
ncbi:MAG TPA: NAD(P)-dependent oxidoreductase [Phototrophicaceae bacterium]|nr:NAD(P)-dependent oxidoreductase [Phototrophicaceae bacterium]